MFFIVHNDFLEQSNGFEYIAESKIYSGVYSMLNLSILNINM